MTGDAATAAELALRDRSELVRFFRGLRWYALPRMAFWAATALLLAFALLPEFLPRYLPLYPSIRTLDWLGPGTIYCGFAATIGAAIEHFSLRGYRGGFWEAEWGRLARAARFWLRWTLVCAGAMIACLFAIFADEYGRPSDDFASLVILVAGALAVGFALWQHALTRLCGAVAEGFAAVELEGSARRTALAFGIVAASSAALALLTCAALYGRSETLGRVVAALVSFLNALLVYALFLLQGILRATANLLAQGEKG